MPACRATVTWSIFANRPAAAGVVSALQDGMLPERAMRSRERFAHAVVSRKRYRWIEFKYSASTFARSSVVYCVYG